MRSVDAAIEETGADIGVEIVVDTPAKLTEGCAGEEEPTDGVPSDSTLPERTPVGDTVKIPIPGCKNVEKP